MRVGVGVDVGVGVSVGVNVAVGVDVGVSVGAGVLVGANVSVAVAVAEGGGSSGFEHDARTTMRMKTKRRDKERSGLSGTDVP